MLRAINQLPPKELPQIGLGDCPHQGERSVRPGRDRQQVVAAAVRARTELLPKEEIDGARGDGVGGDVPWQQLGRNKRLAPPVLTLVVPLEERNGPALIALGPPVAAIDAAPAPVSLAGEAVDLVAPGGREVDALSSRLGHQKCPPLGRAL